MKEIPGWPGYHATRDGRIFSSREMKQFFFKTGRPYVTLRNGPKKKNIHVHTLVLMAFTGPRPEGMECRHLNGDKLDNRIENLCWGTHAENVRDAMEHDVYCCVSARGESNGNSVLTESLVKQSRIRHGQGESITEIAKSIGIERRVVGCAIRKKTWRHVS